MAFAADRTLLAWIRTGVALMGLGFVVARFGLFLSELEAAHALVPVQRPTLSLWIGTALVLLGVLVSILSAASHQTFVSRFEHDDTFATPRMSMGVIVAAVLALIGLVIIGSLLLPAKS